MMNADRPIADGLNLTDLMAVDDNDRGTRSITMEHIDPYSLFENVLSYKKKIFRGKSLGEEFTHEHLDAIRSGKFTDLWLGDYWTDNYGHNLRIWDFNYFAEQDIPHVVIMPDWITSTDPSVCQSYMPTGPHSDGLYYYAAYGYAMMQSAGSNNPANWGIADKIAQWEEEVRNFFDGNLVPHKTIVPMNNIAARITPSKINYISSSGTVQAKNNSAGLMASNGQYTTAILDGEDPEKENMLYLSLPSEMMLFGNSAMALQGDDFYTNTGGDSQQLALAKVNPNFVNGRSGIWLRDVGDANCGLVLEARICRPAMAFAGSYTPTGGSSAKSVTYKYSTFPLFAVGAE